MQLQGDRLNGFRLKLAGLSNLCSHDPHPSPSLADGADVYRSVKGVGICQLQTPSKPLAVSVATGKNSQFHAW